jgi:hypothetical protein
VTEDRTQDAVDHLQQAALELIAAMRAVLDVAEEAIREPQALRDVFAATARAASHAAGTAAGRAATAESASWLSGLIDDAAPTPPRRAPKDGGRPDSPTDAPGGDAPGADAPDASPSTRPAKRQRAGVEHISIT